MDTKHKQPKDNCLVYHADGICPGYPDSPKVPDKQIKECKPQPIEWEEEFENLSGSHYLMSSAFISNPDNVLEYKNRVKAFISTLLSLERKKIAEQIQEIRDRHNSPDSHTDDSVLWFELGVLIDGLAEIDGKEQSE